MIVLGVDQSYATKDFCGFAIINNGHVEKLYSTKFSPNADNQRKRKQLSAVLRHLLKEHTYERVIIERTRMFNQNYFSQATFAAFCELRVTIVDALYESDIPVFSIDTRSWKSKVLLTAKANKDDAITYVKKIYPSVKNHDEADAACIGLSWFLAEQKLFRLER